MSGAIKAFALALSALALAGSIIPVVTREAHACGPAQPLKAAKPFTPPPPGVELDRKLPDSALPATDMETLKGLRAEIARLAAQHQMDAARDVEAQAMKMLGYHEVCLRCGPGICVWMKYAPTPDKRPQTSAAADRHAWAKNDASSS
jgi:hypothetical protein